MSPGSPVIFVVDDDISVRESLELLIRQEGLTVETFSSAQEFLARPRVSAPSCLILDVSLPGLSGLELQKLIAPDRHDMPIIFITGHGDIPMTVQAMKAGAAEFLTKPFWRGSLVESDSWCDRAQPKSLLDREAEILELKARYARLTSREREVLALVVAGLPNKQVGGELEHQRDHSESASRTESCRR